MRINFTSSTIVESIDNNSKHLIICLHGYGQLAKYFINKFNGIKHADVWAVQAPNLFYLNGFSGRIGANWLTKEDRENGIAQQKEILLGIKKLVSDKGYTRIDLCGFSQGVATASRWLMWNEIEFTKVLLQAGEIAPEAFTYLALEKPKNIAMFVGAEDEFFDESKVKLYQKHLNDQGLDISIEPVEGRHSLNLELVGNYFV